MTYQTSTPTPPPSPRPESNRFFEWLRGLGIVRADGWIGGVCGGIAIRTGIDPLIVRGIAIVVAVLGGPALFFYAVAWLLLPDTHGEIHLERMLHGVFDAPLIAIAVLLVAAFFPTSQGVWWVGDHAFNGAWWIAAPLTVIKVLWNLAVVAAIVWFVVWAFLRLRESSRRGERPFGAGSTSRGGGPGAASGASADGTDASRRPAGPPYPAASPDSTASSYSTTLPYPAADAAASAGPARNAAAGAAGAAEASAVVAEDAAEASVAGSSTPGAPAVGAPTTDASADGTTAATDPAEDTQADGAPEVPPSPGAGASRDELSDWRASYADWRERHASWQAAQRAQQRDVRAARSAGIRAQSQALAAEAERRRLARRAANPRTSGWFVALALGVALVAGGLAGAIATQDEQLRRFAGPVGFAVALVVLGLAMVVAGLMRRRAGFLAAMAIAATVLGVAAFGWPAHGTPLGFSRYSAAQNVTLSQFAGQLEIDAARAELPATGSRRIQVEQSFGVTAVYVPQDVSARIAVHSTDSGIHPYRTAPGQQHVQLRELSVTGSGGSPATVDYETRPGTSPELVVDVKQGHGAVFVYYGGTAPNSGMDGE